MIRAVEYWKHWGNTLPHKELDLAGYSRKGDGRMLFADQDTFNHSDSVAHITDHLQGCKDNRQQWRNNADFWLVQSIFDALGKNQSAVMFLVYAQKIESSDKVAAAINEARQALNTTQYWHESRSYDGEGNLVSAGYYYTLPVRQFSAKRAEVVHDSVIQYTERQIRERRKALMNQYDVLADLRCLSAAL